MIILDKLSITRNSRDWSQKFKVFLKSTKIILLKKYIWITCRIFPSVCIFNILTLDIEVIKDLMYIVQSWNMFSFFPALYTK